MKRHEFNRKGPQFCYYKHKMKFACKYIFGVSKILSSRKVHYNIQNAQIEAFTLSNKITTFPQRMQLPEEREWHRNMHYIMYVFLANKFVCSMDSCSLAIALSCNDNAVMIESKQARKNKVKENLRPNCAIIF